ncbi:MAG: zinc metallopeptidase [Candidatus Hydrogenedentes bacterium]|nr:zinc metallopeptidase [Candidatus Hydrogenedentota bacterium]
MGMFDPIGLLVGLIGFAMAMFAQAKVKSAYAKWSQVGARSGITGAEIAKRMMYDNNIDDVSLECIPGEMTDHYDPTAKVVRLSEATYNGRSIAALGIAAHEIGHVIQHAQGYTPLQLRSFVYPVASIGSNAAVPLIMIGLVLSYMGASMPWLIWAGVYLFAAAVAFTFITLPVEFNASSRALKALAHGGILREEEMVGAKSVLNAAALTYVAAAAAAALQLMHFVMIAMNQDRR